MRLPTELAERMRHMLGETEYERFRFAMEEEEAVRGARLCRKAGTEIKEKLITLAQLECVPYGKDCYYAKKPVSGYHPYHMAGALYYQDPGAMCAVAASPLSVGMRVLDLCAAPGGKSSQIADLIGESGILYANEIIPSRARVLASNLERLGVRNAAVLNSNAETLGGLYRAYFDLVLVDAPCSGEGMLRKSEEAEREWSEENVRACAVRQDTILSSIASAVKSGGYLVYATCTFSQEENEGAVLRFLEAHEDFRTVPASEAVVRVTSAGIVTGDVCARADFAHMRRFYPHVSRGEGQFVCVMKRNEDGLKGKENFTSSVREPTKAEMKIAEDFLRDVLCEMPKDVRVVWQSDVLTLLPLGMTVPPVPCLFAGVPLGTLTKGRLVPHHAFFSAYGKNCKRRLTLSLEDARVSAYLHGETIACDGVENGYAAVLLDGAPLGGGKAVSGTMKNHLPKGLRLASGIKI